MIPNNTPAISRLNITAKHLTSDEWELTEIFNTLGTVVTLAKDGDNTVEIHTADDVFTENKTIVLVSPPIVNSNTASPLLDLDIAPDKIILLWDGALLDNATYQIQVEVINI